MRTYLDGLEWIRRQAPDTPTPALMLLAFLFGKSVREDYETVKQSMSGRAR